ncbi:MAG: VCBS repeat-containing protein [Flavobacteriales bacterium]|nr:VCBS repeat-containing protein [Flavobacteriales bacterium]MCB9166698.1 VCBS repeat-containing protein [Flavobacteriales bacterium]
MKGPFQYASAGLPTLAFLVLLFNGCTNEPGPTDATAKMHDDRPGSLFTALGPEESGVTFANQLTESSDINYFTYIYTYNGGGVAVGDLDNDGLPDLYFTGNQVRDRVYRNTGGLHFEDITDKALGDDPGGWRTGVTMADVNGDGFLDIYVCRSGPTLDHARTRNLLYLNNGDLTFREVAEQMGVADTSHSTQAAFLDMDGDGDLDLYVINNPERRYKGVRTSEVRAAIRQGRSRSNRLYRNDGDHFTDVTFAAGLQDYSFSLGVNVSDLDKDGRPDIFVANDFDVADAMYRNLGNGTFINEVQERTRHISNFGMGCDVADFDNDGLPDIMVLDMMSEDHVRSKENMGSMAPIVFWTIVASGNHYQYMVNTLQHNNGNGSFQEIAQMAGVARTDWSWAPLFADLDNDGWKDLLVTNGYLHDIRNNDYQKEVYPSIRDGKDFYQKLDLVPSTRIHNYLYRNNGADSTGRPLLTFSDSSSAWGFNDALNSNGAAYADLDNDGDLDLVINNIDATASVFRNNADTRYPDRHSLRIDLRDGDHHALGAKVTLHDRGRIQYQELQPTRGYQSSVDPVLHFGLGDREGVDSLVVDWPNGDRTVLHDVHGDQLLNLHEEDAGTPAPHAASPRPLFTDVTITNAPGFQHREDNYDDFQLEVLLPHKYSNLGPFLSTGDVNGDGLTDVFVSGAANEASELFLQGPSGTFSPSTSHPWYAHALQEQLGSVLFDADHDGDLDLLVLAGSNEQDVRSGFFAQHLYVNQGGGRFIDGSDALPHMETSAQRCAVSDIDHDGDLDVFIGGRVTPGHYPYPPRSYLLINDGSGHFTDGTEEHIPQGIGPGMITDMRFVDIDGDRDDDLVLVGEWMPLLVFRNDMGRFTNIGGTATPPHTNGWWYGLATADIDGDGDQDLIAGNLGWNSKFQATPDHPLHVYWGDLDGNGRSDIVLAKEKNGHELPVRGRECSSQQCPMILDRFPTYDAFANADLQQIYPPEKLQKALHLEATCMRSAVFRNDGVGHFTMEPLPAIAQTAPINAIVPMDVNGDGHVDLVVAGNNWSAEVETVRYDAGTGLVLTNDGHGHFGPMPIPRSGFFAWGDVKDLALLTTGPDKLPTLLVANNNGRVQAFTLGDRISALSSR